MSNAVSGTDVSDPSLSSSSTVQNGSTEPPQRKPSIHFAPDTKLQPQHSKSRQRVAPTSNESTPIKKSDDNVQRHYNTSDTTLPPPSPQPLEITSASSEQTDSSDNSKGDTSPPWYKRLADKYGSIMLENKSSVARDHLALERTFLAWLRTSLSFASIGIAITQLFRLNASTSSRPSKRSEYSSSGPLSSAQVPFSPMIGQSIPAEMLPYLQYISTTSAATPSQSKLGPTLLDQLLLLSTDGTAIDPFPFSAAQYSVGVSNKLRHVGKPLGATFIGISVLVLLVGAKRYFDAQHWIMQGKFPASRGSITLVAFVAFALIIASLVVVIVISPATYEK